MYNFRIQHRNVNLDFFISFCTFETTFNLISRSMDKKNLFRPNILPFVSHECSVAFCDPVNSVGLLRRGVVQEDKFSDSVYICKYGQIHDCSVSNCGLEESCAVSGICKEYIEEYEDYNKHDSRTWYKEPENVKVFGKRKKIQ